MSTETVAIIILLGTFLGLLCLRVSVAVAMGLAAVATYAYLEIPLAMVVQYTVGGLNNFTFMAVPFFILGGELINQGGLSDKLAELADELVGWMYGGAAMVNVLASDFFGGMSGSCLIFGVKRGLYSNEAGVGSAPNASASAMVSHPVKQGLAQTLSVYIDTMLLCTATALMCLSTGVTHDASVEGAPYVQNAISSLFGRVGPVFITVAMIMFAFTTLLGNLYYADNALAYMNRKKMPGKKFMLGFKIFCILVIFVGAILPSKAAWALADISMGGMTLINIPACMVLGGTAFKALRDYEKQQKEGKDPIFHSKDIGLNEDDFDFWKETP